MSKMKQKIKKFNFAWWECVGNGITAYGISIAYALKEWERIIKLSENRFERDI